MPVPRHEVEGLVQPLVLLLEERVEAGPCLDAIRGERHDLSFCSHAPWMREGSIELRGSGPSGPILAHMVRPRSSSGTRSANSQAVQRSDVSRPAWARTP